MTLSEVCYVFFWRGDATRNPPSRFVASKYWTDFSDLSDGEVMVVKKGSVEMADVLEKNTTGWVAYKQQKFGGRDKSGV